MSNPKQAHQKQNSIAPSSHKHHSLNRKWYITTIAALLTSCYVLIFISGTPRGGPAVKQRVLSNPGGWSHILGGLISMTIGPFQFLITFNKQSPAIHRWLGRAYMTAVAAGGVGSLSLCVTTVAYPAGAWGFAALGTVWLATAAFGWQAARRKDYARHREWMLRNFALTYAAVMLRWQLPLLLWWGYSVEEALTITGFSCWAPNVVFMEWWIGRGEKGLLDDIHLE
ncbi:DUF2306 domain-containing protein [Aspergillus candidus]|uniref:DUF2306 domain-containing protein n=1 Tax=Aspergillus candidus TaxID=41067 RepID=A0A2I2F8E7_ASPCN|nr:hypothetical protein BDW47DRAFT_126792 [Aspergillus candidus]PLB36878.1 hypothetical protein BDW47DRAFT_126792 [Aspergillus candidus]